MDNSGGEAAKPSPRFCILTDLRSVRPNSCDPHSCAPSPATGSGGFGGAIVRISELKKTAPVACNPGPDVLLPARTSTFSPASTRQQQGASTESNSGNKHRERAPRAPRKPRAPRAPRKPRAPRAPRGAGSNLPLTPNGALLPHYWTMTNGRRQLTYGGKVYKGSSAHKLWTQIKDFSKGGAAAPIAALTNETPIAETKKQGGRGQSKGYKQDSKAANVPATKAPASKATGVPHKGKATSSKYVLSQAEASATKRKRPRGKDSTDEDDDDTGDDSSMDGFIIDDDEVTSVSETESSNSSSEWGEDWGSDELLDAARTVDEVVVEREPQLIDLVSSDSEGDESILCRAMRRADESQSSGHATRNLSQFLVTTSDALRQPAAPSVFTILGGKGIEKIVAQPRVNNRQTEVNTRRYEDDIESREFGDIVTGEVVGGFSMR